MIAEETGGRFMEPYLHRLRCDQQQSARSYELLASLSLAKLYQSTGRLVEAHAALAPALEGFTPTPEMSEIAEAQALLGEFSNSSVG